MTPRPLALPFYAACAPWGIYTGTLFTRLPPEQQAAVLAHERAHMTRRHWLRALWPWCDRHALEYEADRIAAEQGHRDGLLWFLATLPEHAATPSHPAPSQRIVKILTETSTTR